MSGKFVKGVRRFSTTIGAGGVADASVTTIPMTTIPAIFQDGDPIEIQVDRVSSTGSLTPDFEEIIYGEVSGTNIVNASRGVAGTAQEHAAGAVVEIKLTASMWNRVMDGILAEHKQDGQHDIEAMKTNGFVKDEDDMASDSDVALVTQQSVKAYSDSAVQTQTNKTLVSPLFQGSINGWISANETWEYVGVDNPTGVFRVNADITGKYSEAMRIKMTNGGNTIYGIITAVSAYGAIDSGYTHITFLHEINPSNSQALYLMANSAITDNFYSTQKAPYGFPTSQLSWSVALSGSAASPVSSPSQNSYDTGFYFNLPIGEFILNCGVRADVATASSTNSINQRMLLAPQGSYTVSENESPYFSGPGYTTTTCSRPHSLAGIVAKGTTKDTVKLQIYKGTGSSWTTLGFSDGYGLAICSYL